MKGEAHQILGHRGQQILPVFGYHGLTQDKAPAQETSWNPPAPEDIPQGKDSDQIRHGFNLLRNT